MTAVESMKHAGMFEAVAWGSKRPVGRFGIVPISTAARATNHVTPNTVAAKATIQSAWIGSDAV
jgi:hypothetical protein